MDSVAALTAALAIAQADRVVSPEEINVLERLCALEALDGWDAMALREQAGKSVDLDAALGAIQDDVDRGYALALCFVMALAGGISPPETAVLRRIAARWGFDDEALAACRREGDALYQRLL